MILQELLKMQHTFGSKFTNFGQLDHIEKQEKLLDFIDHAIEELIEVRRELPLRKHWKKDSKTAPVDYDKVKKEMIDVLHFILTLFLILDMDEHDIFECYIAKHKVNYERQEDGI